MPKKFVLHVFTEDDNQEEDVSFDTEAERTAFASGYSMGTNFYAGDGAYTLTPEELTDSCCMKNDVLKEISADMRGQDNRATQLPIFIIVEDKKIYGVDPDHSSDGRQRIDVDDIAQDWLCTSCAKIYEEGEELPDDCDDCDDTTFVHYRIEKDVPNLMAGFFLTEIACKAHIMSNAHHYDNPRSYVISAWRNPEMKAIMQNLLALTGDVPSHYL